MYWVIKFVTITIIFSTLKICGNFIFFFNTREKERESSGIRKQLVLQTWGSRPSYPKHGYPHEEYATYDTLSFSPKGFWYPKLRHHIDSSTGNKIYDFSTMNEKN